jgi:hypothetical protein
MHALPAKKTAGPEKIILEREHPNLITAKGNLLAT